MENYVRRCTMFAVAWLIIGVIICLSGLFHGNKLVAAADDLDSTQPELTTENVAASVIRLSAKEATTKLPDEGRPTHANAVEPPTMVTIDNSTKIVDFPGEPTKMAQSKEAVSEKPEPDAVAEEIVETTTVEMPVYEAEPEVMAAAVINENQSVFYGKGRYASITLTDEQNELMARLIYHECRGIGGAAVAETVFNRMLSNEFPSTVEDVIYMKNAFSPSGILWTARIDEPEALERCREIPREVLNSDTYLLPSTDYCYFHAGHATLQGDYEYGGNVFYADYAAHH